MLASDTRAISRVVLYNRERAVLLEPRDNGMVLWTLRYGDEVRNPTSYFRGIAERKADPDEKGLLARLIAEHKRPWGPELAKDPVQEALLDMTAARQTQAKRGRRKETGPSAARL